MSLFSNRFTIIAALLMTLVFTPSLADQTDTDSAKSSEEVFQPTTNAVTVYLDVSWGSRTKKAASRLNESHAKYESAGYILQDIDLYTENGDLKGFFVTYRKF